ncbi:tetratricopeptide repeat protein [Paludisphaera sp. Pla2]|uniref:Tetratricopeptide repeat protein n=2 Tax=Paludisphaera mucosa TaxID=3030827 RepID=A0ABT6FIS5_9BACT|nr:tetratricopeptide repeat protein [Paludisphaera mucosa]MDG3007486.1 tetratricopeptide repeat protein [Paludisphaera mucosa]
MGALSAFEALLPDHQRVFGDDHSDTLNIRSNIATWKGLTGNKWGALAAFEALLRDQTRVLGSDHPYVFRTRSNIAYWRGRTGNPLGALTAYEALLPDREQAQGRDHPDTLAMLASMGDVSIQVGCRAEGCRRFREALARARRRFGPDHDLTRRFEQMIDEHGCEKTDG